MLLLLFALPLGLSVSYKRFIGGSTTVEYLSTDVTFGFTAAPGYQLIGNGLSLLVEVYLPFWIKPSLGRAYGFNLYVATDNTTAAVLDAPLPNDLVKIQASLNDFDSMTITATVNATVAEKIDPSPSGRDDNEYWTEKKSLFSETGTNPIDSLRGVYQSMWAGANNGGLFNYTETFLSLYNTTENQTFQSEAERYVSTRRTCVGVWNITRLNVSLVDVASLQSAEEVTQNQDIIVDMMVSAFFLPFLGEYDWKTRASWDQPLPGNSDPETPLFFPLVNTRPALVASMLWARLTSNDGPERPGIRFDPSFPVRTSYSKDPSELKFVKKVVTLQRSPWLIVILAIHPVLTILAVLAKATLYTTPIGDGFGVISLLAGMREEGLDVLRGAGFSGKVSRKIAVRFTASKEEGSDYEQIQLDLDSRDKSDRLEPKKRYG